MALHEAKYLNLAGETGVDEELDWDEQLKQLKAKFPDQYESFKGLLDKGIAGTEEGKEGLSADSYTKADLFDMSEAAPLAKLGYGTGELLTKGMSKLFGDKEGKVGLGYGEGEWAPGKGLLEAGKWAKDKLFKSPEEKAAALEAQAQEGVTEQKEIDQTTADAQEGRGGDVVTSGIQENIGSQYGEGGEFAGGNPDVNTEFDYTDLDKIGENIAQGTQNKPNLFNTIGQTDGQGFLNPSPYNPDGVSDDLKFAGEWEKSQKDEASRFQQPSEPYNMDELGQRIAGDYETSNNTLGKDQGFLNLDGNRERDELDWWEEYNNEEEEEKEPDMMGLGYRDKFKGLPPLSNMSDYLTNFNK